LARASLGFHLEIVALEWKTEGSDVVKHDATITGVLPGNGAFRLGIAFYGFKLFKALCSEVIERKKGKRKPLAEGKRLRMVGVILRTGLGPFSNQS